MIASTDGYVLLLGLQDQHIFAYRRNQHWSECKVVASDFDLFIRTAGTLFLDRLAREAETASSALSSLVGCDPASSFWKMY